MSKWANNNSRLKKTTEHYRRVGEYKKEELDDISKQLGIFAYNSKGSRAWESK